MKRMMSWLVPTFALLATPALAEDSRENKPFDVSAQAGLLTFTGEAANFTSPGVSYGVLAGMDVLPWLGGELSYQGAAYVTDGRLSPGDNDIGISENGGQAVVKAGPRLGGIQPYALGGLALSFLNVKDRESAFGVVEDATLIKVPLGAGVDWHIPGNMNDIAQFSLGARATYNLTVDSGAFPTTDNATSSSQFLTTLQMGARF
jgi:hypothetical protein